ncbi:MAG TPA: PIG-L deacetylase family protein [Tepidisphaeraceae bacterium]|jgi:LmbE family N-acetylglucosaminyl deacetylase|nr:PIG-L deacetylase family protein [Tepidisphaeraceae bacterium]
MNKTVLSFLAHPDDAEFLCTGTLIRLQQLGWSVHIASATAGDCGTTIYDRFQISAIRTAENAKSAGLIGATYHCLGEEDLMVVYDKPTIRKTLNLFRRIAPSLVFTHPAKDYHMDHEAVSLLARCASFGYGAPNASEFPLLAGSGVPHLYYCDPVEGVDPLGHPVQPTTIVDISEQMETKTAMLACHASQREWLRLHHGTDEYLDSMRKLSKARGKLIDVNSAEGFVQHRGHAYPGDDLLVELLGARAWSLQ